MHPQLGAHLGGHIDKWGHNGERCAPKLADDRVEMPPMLTNKLTDTAIRKAKHGEKSVKMADGGGL